MSYIQAFKVTPEFTPSDTLLIGIAPDSTPKVIDNNLDEMLSFVVALIRQVDELAEGEVLVIRKEIF